VLTDGAPGVQTPRVALPKQASSNGSEDVFDQVIQRRLAS
jgi:hypothetical protein